jgi:hypothetical protein
MWEGRPGLVTRRRFGGRLRSTVSLGLPRSWRLDDHAERRGRAGGRVVVYPQDVGLYDEMAAQTSSVADSCTADKATRQVCRTAFR